MLSDAFLSRLDTLRLAMRGRASGGAGGVRRSRQLGSSAEFSDYREYIPGDDIRRLDWNALARFDRLFVKLFMEEQESVVTILLDASASMSEKWDVAVQAAEALGYLALTGGDRLRVICLRGQGNRVSPPLAGRPAYARLESFLRACAPEGEGTLTEAVKQAQGLQKGLCFLISDCYQDQGIGPALDYLRYCRQECGVVQVLSAFEMDPALDGAWRLQDSETGAEMPLLADRGAMAAYARTLQSFLSKTQAACRSREATYLLLDGRQSFEENFIPSLSRSMMI